MVTAHFQLYYVPYHTLHLSLTEIQNLHKLRGKGSLPVILCVLYPLEHNHYSLNKKLLGVAPQSLPAVYLLANWSAHRLLTP